MSLKQVQLRAYKSEPTNAYVRNTPGGEHCVLRAEAVQRAVFEANSDHAFADTVLHQQVQREVLDEVLAVEAQRLHRRSGIHVFSRDVYRIREFLFYLRVNRTQTQVRLLQVRTRLSNALK